MKEEILWESRWEGRARILTKDLLSTYCQGYWQSRGSSYVTGCCVVALFQNGAAAILSCVSYSSQCGIKRPRESVGCLLIRPPRSWDEKTSSFSAYSRWEWSRRNGRPMHERETRKRTIDHSRFRVKYNNIG